MVQSLAVYRTYRQTIVRKCHKSRQKMECLILFHSPIPKSLFKWKINAYKNHLYFDIDSKARMIASVLFRNFLNNYKLTRHGFNCLYGFALLVAKLLLKFFCPSVRFSGKRDFMRPYIRQSSHFFVCTFLLYMSIYSTNILSVGLSVRLQKAKELRYLWMLSSLF